MNVVASHLLRSLCVRSFRHHSTLVSTEWLATQLHNDSPHLKVLDASWYMPKDERQCHKEFLTCHIPSASFFCIDECSDKNTDLPHMLPPSDQFEKYVSERGVDNTSHVVVYDSNKEGLFSAQRAWWMFRVFGHDSVSILDGGLQKWRSEERQVESGPPALAGGSFTARFRPQLVRSFDYMLRYAENAERGEAQMLDARSAGRFSGAEPDPRQGLSSGHIEGSWNIPYRAVINPETKLVRSVDELRQMFEELGIDLSKPMISSCGSGVTACHLALAAFLCGHEELAVYDGAWTEWAQRAPPHLIKTTC